ncbi:TRAP transporter small permease [Rhodoplanes roseus]|nr:TRAP transporter small permease subunit [Rhodoplanes roseus]
MAGIERVASALANGLAVIGLTLLLILAAFTMADGILRAFANTPLDFVRELGDMVAAIAGAACLPIALFRESNIVLRALGRTLPPVALRVVDTVAALVVEIVMVGMAWQFWLHSTKAMQAGEVTWMLEVPKAPFWFVVDGVLWIGVVVQAVVLVGRALGTRRIVETETAA